MIKIEIEINEKESKLYDKFTSRTKVVADIQIEEINATRGEKESKDYMLKNLHIDKKHDIIDNTKNKRFKKLQEELKEILGD